MINASKMLTILDHFSSTLTSYNFLLTIFTITFFIKIYIIFKLIVHKQLSSRTKKQLSLLLIAIGGATIINSAWILKIIRRLFFPETNYKIFRFWMRITWAFNTIHHHALSLFIESLVKKKNLVSNWKQRILIPISGFICLFFVTTAFTKFNKPYLKSKIESTILSIIPYYYLFPLLIMSGLVVLLKLRSDDIPLLLKKQLKILFKFIFFPIIATEFMYLSRIISLYSSKRYTINCISTVLLTYGMCHCIKKIMGFRFLNFKPHVQTPKKFVFVNDFKNILEKLSSITNTRELVHITKSFFKDAFSIPIQKTHLYIRKINNNEKQEEEFISLNQDETIVETFFSTHNKSMDIQNFFIKEKIAITNELAFSNFYKEEKISKKIISFLNYINADIFVPIYDKQRLIAYIIIEKYARIENSNKHSEFYSNLERDQIIVFSNYLENLISLINTRNINKIIKQEKKLNEILHIKDQEIIHYKESIRSFLRNGKEKKIGVVFYKNRRFTIGNQTAQELVLIDLNKHSGHIIPKQIKKIANQVLEYKSPQTCFIQNDLGEKLVISGIPNVGQNNIIISIRYPEISDILKNKINLLKDPKKWEYLLYLETTEHGKFINQIIPSNNEVFLNFKVDLLQSSMSKKAILLIAPEQDLESLVEVLHHVSSKETLHTITLKKEEKNFSIASELFGLNPILDYKPKTKPILEKLDKTGTLFIKNFHFMHIETQNHLAEYIKYGFYRNFKGHNRKLSNVRIICSTNIDLEAASQNETVSLSLIHELKKTQIKLPPLNLFSDEAIINLAIEFAKQTTQTNEFHHLLKLTPLDKNRIIKFKPTSIHELKNKIRKKLIKKSKKHLVYEETQFDPAYNITNPELVEAARLGKHALKDPKIMTMLWNKFKNQNKIATLLGVNRSSVNRRCKDYNLI